MKHIKLYESFLQNIDDILIEFIDRGLCFEDITNKYQIFGFYDENSFMEAKERLNSRNLEYNCIDYQISLRDKMVWTIFTCNNVITKYMFGYFESIKKYKYDAIGHLVYFGKSDRNIEFFVNLSNSVLNVSFQSEIIKFILGLGFTSQNQILRILYLFYNLYNPNIMVYMVVNNKNVSPLKSNGLYRIN